MNIVIVTRDVGPGHSLRIIGSKLTGLGHRVETFLGNGKPLPEDGLDKISEAITQADLLLISVSSLKDGVLEEKHAFEEARWHTVPVAVFADNYGMYHRPWFRDLMIQTDILFVVDEQEVATARQYVNDRTKIVPSGNPYWAEFFKTTVGRNEIRARLGIKPDEKMILAGGTKEIEKNVPLYTDLVIAARYFKENFRENVHLVLTMHPGASHTKDVYDGILKWSVHPVQFPPKDIGLTTQEMIAGSDLVVSGGGSTISIMAACQRVPVIDLIHPLDALWWEELSGLTFWPPTKSGASKLVEDSRSLAQTIYYLLDKESVTAKAMQDAQEENFSPKNFEESTEKIVAGLLANR